MRKEVSVTVRLTEEEARKLEELADAFQVSKAEVLREALKMLSDLAEVVKGLKAVSAGEGRMKLGFLGILSSIFAGKKFTNEEVELITTLFRELKKKDPEGFERRWQVVKKIFEKD